MHYPFLTRLPTLTLFLSLASCVASVRPGSVDPLRPDPAAEARGRQLLEAAAIAHGRTAWQAAETLRFTMTDTWSGLLGTLGNPWPESSVTVQMDLRTGTFDARAKFLKGKAEGAIWGLQSFQSYVVAPAGPAVFKEDSDIRFILPALQYLLEFPFRAGHAQQVVDAGPEVVNGVTYDRVFLTWGGLEAHRGADQFVAYLSQQTGRVEKVHYTVRDFASFATGTVHYADFRDVGGGLLIPARQFVTSDVGDAPEDAIHVIEIDPASVRIDAVPETEFIVNPELPRLGDEKPV